MLSFDNVSVRKGDREIIRDISFDIKPHTLTVIIGKNASGKTTLLSALISAVRYTGKISFCRRDIALMNQKERSRVISYLSQDLPRVGFTVEELVRMGRTPYLDIGRRFNDSDLRAVEKALELTGISDMKEKTVATLSGGEKQKAYLAMTLAQETRIIALDEPTTYLDAEHQKEIISLMTTLKKEHKKTVIAVMHDINYALEIADNILFMSEGSLIFSGTADECIESGLIEKEFKMQKIFYDVCGEKRILFR